VAIDTENLPDGTPYCLTYSFYPGMARLIYANDKPTLTKFFEYLTKHRPLIHLHNYLHDVEILHKMGLDIPHTRFLDTMVRAYELGIGGGGGGDGEDSGGRGSLSLKILAYRHLHMHMTTFKDTVMPFTLPRVISWLKEGLELTYQPKSTKHFKRDVEQGRLYLKIANLLESLMENKMVGGKLVDPWDRVSGWHPWEQELLLYTLGSIPVLDISTIPESALLPYACSDADATLRLAHFLSSYHLPSI
jgi:hypothetical protein